MKLAPPPFHSLSSEEVARRLLLEARDIAEGLADDLDRLSRDLATQIRKDDYTEMRQKKADDLHAWALDIQDRLPRLINRLDKIRRSLVPHEAAGGSARYRATTSTTQSE